MSGNCVINRRQKYNGEPPRLIGMRETTDKPRLIGMKETTAKPRLIGMRETTDKPRLIGMRERPLTNHDLFNKLLV